MFGHAFGLLAQAVPSTAHLFWGEVVGTGVLILLGDGVVAGVLLNKSKAQNSGWIVITWAWAMGVLFGVYTSVAVGGLGHLNPAVTIALWAGDQLKGFGGGDIFAEDVPIAVELQAVHPTTPMRPSAFLLSPPGDARAPA